MAEEIAFDDADLEAFAHRLRSERPRTDSVLEVRLSPTRMPGSSQLKRSHQASQRDAERYLRDLDGGMLAYAYAALWYRDHQGANDEVSAKQITEAFTNVPKRDDS